MSSKLMTLLLAVLFSAALPGCAWIANCGMRVDHTYPALPTTEKEALISMALRRVLIDEKGIRNYGWPGEEDEIVLLDTVGFGDSTEVLTAGALPETDKIKFILLSRERMKKLADCWAGDFIYLRVDVIDIDSEEATVGIWTAWAQSSRSRVMRLSGGGYRLLYRKQDGEWVFEKILSAFVS